MSEVQKGGSGGPRRLIGAVGAVVLLLAGLYGVWALVSKPGHGDGSLKDLAHGGLHALQVLESPGPQPANPIQGPDGKVFTLADHRGKVLIVNLWATWCAPCREEMPTLARLKAEYAGKAVEIIPVSIDRDKDADKARSFIAANAPLAYYHADSDLAFGLKPPAMGMPTTLIYDASGKERGRVSGKADWTSAEAHQAIDRLLHAHP